MDNSDAQRLVDEADTRSGGARDEIKAWLEPQPDGSRRRVEWEPWMPPWPVVLTLIDNIGITAHDDPAQFRALCAQYHAMMARRPREGNEVAK